MTTASSIKKKKAVSAAASAMAKARAKKLSPKRREKIARDAANARWQKVKLDASLTPGDWTSDEPDEIP